MPINSTEARTETRRAAARDTFELLSALDINEVYRGNFTHDVDVATVFLFFAQWGMRLENVVAKTLLTSSKFHPENLEEAFEIDPSLRVRCIDFLENHPRLLQRFAAVSMTKLIRERLAHTHPTYFDYSQTPARPSVEDILYFKGLKCYEVLVWCRVFDMIPTKTLVSLCRRTPHILDAVVAFLNDDHPSPEEESFAKSLAETLAKEEQLWQRARVYQAAAFVQACSFSIYPVALYAPVAKHALGKHLAYLWDEPSRNPLDLTELWYSLSNDTQADVVESLAPVLLDNDLTPSQKDVCDRFLRESTQSGKSALRALNTPFSAPLKHAARQRLSAMTLSQRSVLKLLLHDTEAPFDDIVASLKTL